jgi:predicted PurR-regulated permease PerM
VIALFFILVVPGVWLFAALVGQLPDAIRSFQQSPAVERIMALQIGSLPVGPQLQRAAAELLQWGSRQTLGALSGLLAATINLVIALFGTYYLLTSGDRLWERAKAMLPFCPTTAELLRARFHRVTEAMLLGVVFAALAQATLVGIALAALGFQHALLWSVVTAVVSILPMFGSALVWGPAALFLGAHERFPEAIALAVFGIVVVSNVDNALRLLVYKRVSQIHPMVTFVGALAGVSAFGIVGLLLGPLVLFWTMELVTVHYFGESGSNGNVRPDAPPLFAARVAGISINGSTALTR